MAYVRLFGCDVNALIDRGTCMCSTSHFMAAAGRPRSTRRLNCSTPSILYRDTAAIFGMTLEP